VHLLAARVLIFPKCISSGRNADWSRAARHDGYCRLAAKVQGSKYQQEASEYPEQRQSGAATMQCVLWLWQNPMRMQHARGCKMQQAEEAGPATRESRARVVLFNPAVEIKAFVSSSLPCPCSGWPDREPIGDCWLLSIGFGFRS
jgi:hypothetical protein